jgi:hypothetical protein
MMKIVRTVVLLVALGVAGLSFAQDTSDFNGAWVLNVKKGENLGMVAAIEETLVIAQTAEQMVVDFTDVFRGKTSTRQVTYDLSGAPVNNFAAMGDPSETTSEWVDGKLVTMWSSEGAIAGTRVVRSETRALTDEGQVMTVTTVRGESPTMMLVYEKQN